MISKIAERVWRAALLTLNPECLIDKFLDWLDELSGTLVPPHLSERAGNQMRTEALYDPFRA